MNTIKNKQQINKIYSQYYSLMYMVAFRILNNHADAEDVVQIAFVKLIEKNLLKKIDDNKIKAFLTIVVRNQAFDFYRRQNKIDYIDNNPDGYFSASEGKLSEAINALPQDMRDVLILKFYVGYSSREIAAALGLKWNTIQKKISHSKQLLKKELDNND